jgi:hypothetical protein
MTNAGCRNEKFPNKGAKLLNLHADMTELCLYNACEQVKLAIIKS